MKTMRCRFFRLRPVSIHSYVADIIRLDDHPVLGPPNGKFTITSPIKAIDFMHGVIITTNSIYVFRDEPPGDEHERMA